MLSTYEVIFYFFATMLVLSAVFVVTARNAVKSILFLILAFFCSSVLWMMIQAEFLSLVLIFLYVGAVMVLFLFVVMMIDFNAAFSHQPPKVYALLGLLFLVLFLAIISLALISSHLPMMQNSIKAAHSSMSNTHRLGHMLYTQYIYEFEVAGAILLVAIIAAISLAFSGKRDDTKQQNINQQHEAKKSERLKIIKMEGEA
jgi:NADH-quinone oxidoreductase subunit J